MKRLAWAIVIAVVVSGFVQLLVGPRMHVQPHIRAFQVPMPALPKGVVPVQAAPSLPTADAAKKMSNPLAATPANLKRGRTYYGYYCQFCHGAAGAGDGPVGQSYVPAPADLRSARVQAYSDGELLRAMFTGIPHAPVLEKIVPPEHWWYLVLYTRSLAPTAP